MIETPEGWTPIQCTDPDLIYHKFMGSAHDPYPNIKDHILCWVGLDEIPQEQQGVMVSVAIFKKDVTCQDCIELIHS